MEKYLFISVAAYGPGFVLRPGVLILAPLVVLGVVFTLRGRRRPRQAEPEAEAT